MPAKLSEEQEKKIIRMLTEFLKISDNKLADRVEGWQLSEKMNQSYMPAEDAERLQKQRDGKWTDSFTKLSVPYCYAVQMALHTYVSSVLLSRSPVYQSLGRTGQGQNQMQAVDSLLDYQYTAGGFGPYMYLWLNDIFGYGVGIHGYSWDVDETSVTAYGERQKTVNGIGLVDDLGQPEMEEFEDVIVTKGYEGHRMFNVRPSEAIMDTRVGLVDYQNGEFFGRRLRWSTSTLEEKKHSGYFNIEAAKELAGDKENDLAGDNPALVEKSDELAFGAKIPNGQVPLIEMYVKIVPKEYGLGKNDRREIWRFTMASKKVLIEARPAGWFHGKFPYIVQPFEFDGYGLTSRSVATIGMPLNQTIDWLLNSHMYNVKKAVNNEFIYDPTMISAKDFLDPRPGKRVRLLPAGYGKDVRNMIYQIPQVDYTRQNISDISFIEGIFQRIFGATPQMMGGMQSGGRRSATEVRQQNAGGVSRLQVLTEYISACSMAPAFSMLLSGSRQMYKEDMILRIAGDSSFGQNTLKINPGQLEGDFDFIPVDGTMPIDRFATAALYKELLTEVMQIPAITGRYDIAAIFAFIAKMSGIRNLDTFQIKPEDYEKIQREVQLGNMVSSKEALNGRVNSGGGDGESAGNRTSPPGTPTVGRLGTTG